MFGAFSLIPLFTILSLSPVHVSAALQNASVDDQDFSKINYINPLDWAHDPLIGYEYQFFNGSRSYTYIPGASASLTFTGSGVYLQGPPAPDQAQRRVFLDGQDMGAYNLQAPEREYCRVFWSASQLPYTTHTVVVAHNDTPSLIFAMDVWFVEFDPSQNILPFSTTTTTTTAATQTVTTTPTDVHGTDGTVSGSPNTPDVNAANPKSYSTIIIAIVVPTLLFTLLCIGGFCIYRSRRRSRSAHHRRKDSIREKFLRRGRQNQVSSPLAPLFGKQAEGTGLGRAESIGRGRDSDDSRAYASTRYSTALDHEYNSDQDHTRAQLSRAATPVPPIIIPPANILDPRVLSAAMSNPLSSTTSLTALPPAAIAAANTSSTTNSIRPLPATFDPPNDWRTTLNSPPASPLTRSHPDNNNHTHTHMSTQQMMAGTGAGAGAGLTSLSERTARTLADAYRGGGGNGLASNARLAPSTVFSETESAYSIGLGAPPARHYRHQHQDGRTTTRDAAAATADREDPQEGEGEFGSPPASPTPSNSVLRRFSTAITSTLPFTRSGSRPNSRHSNSLAMSTTHTGSNSANRDGSGAGHNTTTSGEDPESNGGRGYFHGMNHFNLGIALNYRPTASASPATLNNNGNNGNNGNGRASSPTASPTQGAPSTRLGRPSVNSNGLGSDDMWPGNRPTSTSTAPASPMDDAAFSSYTRFTRERVLGYREGDNAGAAAAVGRDSSNSNSGTHSTPPVPPVSSSLNNSSDGGGVGKGDVDGERGGGEEEEKEDKEDKIVEALDGETIHEEGEDQWSIDHGTLASNGGASVGAEGVTRTSSLNRQRSVRSTADQGRAVIPPPYSVYIPPDTKPSPPPGSQ